MSNLDSKARKVNDNATSLAAGALGVFSTVVNSITTFATETLVITMDALLSDKGRGLQALAGIAALCIYSISAKCTYLMFLSLDPAAVWTARMMCAGFEGSKVVASFKGFKLSKPSRFVQIFAICAVLISIFSTMAYYKNSNNEIKMKASKGSDKYMAETAQRESLLSELQNIDARIAKAEDAASAAAASTGDIATKASTIDPAKKELANAAKAAKDAQADAIQVALNDRLASYSPNWLAKNASEVAKMKEKARTDISALRSAGVDAYNKELGQVTSYEEAKATAEATATRLEGEAQKLRDRKAVLMKDIGEAAGKADKVELVTSGYLAVFEKPETGEEYGELIVNLGLAAFLEVAAGMMLVAYNEFGDEHSNLYQGAKNLRNKIKALGEDESKPSTSIKPLVTARKLHTRMQTLSANKTFVEDKPLVTAVAAANCDSLSDSDIKSYMQWLVDNSKDGVAPSQAAAAKGVGVTLAKGRRIHNHLALTGQIEIEGKGAWKKTRIK